MGRNYHKPRLDGGLNTLKGEESSPYHIRLFSADIVRMSAALEDEMSC